jgi:iron complex transport system substrate-binding protein
MERTRGGISYPTTRRNDVTQRIAVSAGLLVTILAASLSAMAAEGFPATVVDDRGRVITIGAQPKRIVAVGALYAEIVVDVGALDQLIAVAASDENPPETEALPTVGPTYAPNVELIIGLGPDLVLGATDWGGERPTLEAAGVPVFTTPMLTGVSNIFASIRSVGTAIGRTSESASLIGRIAEAIVEIEAAVLGRQPISAAFLYASTPDAPPYAAGHGSIEHELILRAGGANAFADVENFPQVSFEEILARDPDVIFTAPRWIENVYRHPLLQGVSAVRDGRVVGIRGSQVASTQVAEALRAMAKALHDVDV